jgi:hypothetical protein
MLYRRRNLATLPIGLLGLPALLSACAPTLPSQVFQPVPGVGPGTPIMLDPIPTTLLVETGILMDGVWVAVGVGTTSGGSVGANIGRSIGASVGASLLASAIIIGAAAADRVVKRQRADRFSRAFPTEALEQRFGRGLAEALRAAPPGARPISFAGEPSGGSGAGYPRLIVAFGLRLAADCSMAIGSATAMLRQGDGISPSFVRNCVFVTDRLAERGDAAVALLRENGFARLNAMVDECARGLGGLLNQYVLQPNALPAAAPSDSRRAPAHNWVLATPEGTMLRGDVLTNSVSGRLLAQAPGRSVLLSQPLAKPGFDRGNQADTTLIASLPDLPTLDSID